MKLNELVLTQKVILQIVWGEQKVEFTTEVVEVLDDGVYVSAALHDGKPLEFNISSDSRVMCHIFADDFKNNNRVSWKNVAVKTVTRADGMAYLLTTNSYNSLANIDDRRKENRVKIQKKAKLYDGSASDPVDIMIFDISDAGLSFYAPVNYSPSSPRFTIMFNDSVADQDFAMKIECVTARTKSAVGMMLYGCEIVATNREYLLYGCLKRMGK